MRNLPNISVNSPTLESSTVRDFSGGWNVLDRDINLNSNFAPKLYNLYYGGNSTIKMRYGYRLFADLRTAIGSLTAYIVNVEYYGAAVIAVLNTGEILSVLGDGTTDIIWNSAIAAALPGSPAGWSATTFASFEQFNGSLIICNGIDKPLIVNSSLVVNYLQDLATLTNINTPIAKYVTTVDRYLVMAGNALFPNRVYISARDTSGTWFGDPAPNDATFIDVGSSLKNASVVKGIKGYRGQLIIAFEEGTIIAQLGTYDSGGDHQPDVGETVQQYGSVSHRTMVDTGDDLFTLDGIGVPSMKRTVFSGSIRPERVSDLVDDEIANRLATLNTDTLEDRTFAVYDQRESIYMFFAPNADTQADTTETTAYIYSYRPKLKVAAWARFDNMNFTCGCRSLQGNLFFGDKDGKLWLFGNQSNPIYKDKLNDPSVNNSEGQTIPFTWELPWLDFNQRGRVKKTKYIGFDTVGLQAFTVSMYIDRITENDALEDTPLLSTEFVAGDVGGYGGEDAPFGSGRVTSDERLYAWPAKFKLAKIKITGEGENQLEFAAITIWYSRGRMYL